MAFMTRFGDQEVTWSIPAGEANLRVLSAFSGIWDLQSVAIRNAAWKVALPGALGNIEGVLNAQAEAETPAPDGLPRDTIWSGTARVEVPSVRGAFRGKPLDLVYQSRLTLTPFSLRDGAPHLPYDFQLVANLTELEGGAALQARGHHVPLEKNLDADIQLVGIDPPLVERYLVLAHESRELRDFRIADWVEDGSFSVRLTAHARLTKVNGEISFRFLKVRFGSEVHEVLPEGEVAQKMLGLFEGRTDTVQLGPIPFTEDLATPKEEAWDQIQRGLLAALLKAGSGEALKSGTMNLLKGVFGK
jgi:hypothetical protein